MAVKNNKTISDTLNEKQKRVLNELFFESAEVDIQGIKVLKLSGEIDIYSAPKFRSAVMHILDEDELHLIIDMQNVRYMDSSGFAILVTAIKRLSPNGGTMSLVGCTSTINRMLHVIHLDSIISLYQNMDDAMESLLPIDFKA